MGSEASEDQRSFHSRVRRSGAPRLLCCCYESLPLLESRPTSCKLIHSLFPYCCQLLSLLLQKEAWDPVEALTAVYIIHGVSCISSPIGGWFADSLIGRFWTIVLGMLIYISGYSMLTALSINQLKPLGCDWPATDIKSANTSNVHWHIMKISAAPENCFAHIYSILVLVGVGVGFTRANIPPFGAEQVRAGGDHSVREFFNVYYWCINFGSLLGVCGLAYVEQNIEHGFFISFVVATVALGLSLICFCAGRRYYLIHRPGNLIILNVFRIICKLFSLQIE